MLSGSFRSVNKYGLVNQFKKQDFQTHKFHIYHKILVYHRTLFFFNSHTLHFHLML